MATLTNTSLSTTSVNNVDVASADLTAASSGGDLVTNPTGDVMLLLENTSGSSRTVTVAAQTTSRPGDGAFPTTVVEDQAFVMADGETKLVGPFPTAYNNGDQQLEVTYSSEAGVKLLPIKLNR